MSNQQTDNTYFQEKVKLRIDNLPNKKTIKVLDCYAGEGKIWNYIKANSKKDIQILSIDKEQKQFNQLLGDNVKFLKMLTLSNFDIIDLDAYGIPFKQMEILFDREYKGIVCVTYVMSVFGSINRQLLHFIGYPKKMVKKIPTLFYKNPLKKLENYLYIKGVRKIKGYFIGKYSYLTFKL